VNNTFRKNDIRECFTLAVAIYAKTAKLKNGSGQNNKEFSGTSPS